jgi:hypothetical protein
MKTVAALAFILLSAPIAHADNICQQSQDFGLSPDQIAKNLRDGDPTLPLFRARGKVLNRLGACDPP